MTEYAKNLACESLACPDEQLLQVLSERHLVVAPRDLDPDPGAPSKPHARRW